MSLALSPSPLVCRPLLLAACTCSFLRGLASTLSILGHITSSLNGLWINCGRAWSLRGCCLTSRLPCGLLLSRVSCCLRRYCHLLLRRMDGWSLGRVLWLRWILRYLGRAHHLSLLLMSQLLLLLLQLIVPLALHVFQSVIDLLPRRLKEHSLLSLGFI